MDPRIVRVLALLDTPTGMLSTVSDIAAHVNLSPSRLRHLFREQVAMSLGCYVRARRLRLAEELLRSTFMSVKEIAAATGFADQSHFVRTFHGAYTISPGRFRHSASAGNR